MSLPGAARRVRAYGGQFLLLAVLTLVTALLITGVPRVADRLTGQGLTEYVAGQPVARRDLTYSTAPTVVPPAEQPVVAGRGAQLAAIEEKMPAEVRATIGERWFAAQTVPGRLRGPTLRDDKGLIDLHLRAGTGIREAATLVDGRWPERGVTPAGAIEVTLAETIATTLGLAAGDRFRFSLLNADGNVLKSRPVDLVGVWRPNDPAGGVWDTLPSMLKLAPPENDGDPFVGVAYTADAGLDSITGQGWPVTFGWRYRIAPDRLEPGRLDALIADVDGLDRARPTEIEMALSQGVDIPLRRFADSLAAAQTLLAVIAAGLLATLAGLTLLAARLAARRRRAEFHLIRARGGSTGAVLRRGLAESLLVLPAAAGVGWLLGGLLPGSGASWRWVLIAALLATLLPPLAALAAGRAGGRSDLGGRSPAVRLTVEVVVLGLAVLGAFLLRRRGLTAGTVDPLLISVPVLLAIAAALLVLRAYPWPLRLVSRLAARARGSVAFLGTARAGRAASTGPLVVVVMAVATAAFCGVVATGIETGRDTAAAQAVPGDLLVRGERFTPDTAGRLAELPGVRAVAPVLTIPAERPYADRAGRPAPITELRVVLVDGERFAEVARQADVPVSVPDPVRARTDGSTPLPALVSPAVAGELADAGLADAQGDRPAWLDVQGNRLPVRTAATVDEFALVGEDVRRFVVLPWPALPADAPHQLAPTGFVLAGSGVDAAEVDRVAQDGQRRYLRIGGVDTGDKARAPEVTTRSAVRADLGGAGVNGLLVFGFVLGAGGGAALGLLGLALAVLAGARSRGQVLSRLRTMGLSRRQWRGLLMVELTPLVLVSVLTGAVVGALLPLLLTPVLGLPAFTGGVEVRPSFEPGLMAGVSVLAMLALGFAITVEAVNNRRLRLGEVLRLGEES
ncbi:FtsX-like permease family protein [Micromonospora marina]|uniref:Putative ABC transport system permease protein n=1 Tax=Micromonospora marina TaxID=307120 RepID=A0A1C4WIW8_9ACTN|nr:FtsX-like permease family protein [Micromonospora marina]SCE96236.1 putative ABC transport system permease protein [Micromonospora marina]